MYLNIPLVCNTDTLYISVIFHFRLIASITIEILLTENHIICSKILAATDICMSSFDILNETLMISNLHKIFGKYCVNNSHKRKRKKKYVLHESYIFC